MAQYLLAGVPDPRGVLGEVAYAFVVADAAEFSAGAFLRQARRKLPSYMVPRRVLRLDALPLTPTGEPDRRAAARTLDAE